MRIIHTYERAPGPTRMQQNAGLMAALARGGVVSSDMLQTADMSQRPLDPPIDLGNMTEAISRATNNGHRRGWDIEYHQTGSQVIGFYSQNNQRLTRAYIVDWHRYGARGGAALFNFMAELADERNHMLRFATEDNPHPNVEFEYLEITIVGRRT